MTRRGSQDSSEAERDVSLGKTPKLRILCFPNAGNMEDMYTHEGTGARRATSPLLEFAKTHEAEVLAVQYPGRGNRSKESCAFEIDEIIHPSVARGSGEVVRVPIRRHRAFRRLVDRLRVLATANALGAFACPSTSSFRHFHTQIFLTTSGRGA